MIQHEIVRLEGWGVVGTPSRPMNQPEDGGHLLVLPPRRVWDRTALQPQELVQWSLLVAATAAAMLSCLEVLRDGCLNYWEAGNFALNDLSPPAGPKDPRTHREMHLHLFGRSRRASHPDWKWGQSPRFPRYEDSGPWCSQFSAFDDATRARLGNELRAVLARSYGHRPG